MTLPTYEQLAAQRGVRRCRGIDPQTGLRCYERHVAGAVTQTNDGTKTIHWSDRGVTRTGIRNFLLLLAEHEVLRTGEPDRWRRYYYALRTALEWSQEAHVRLPAKLWAPHKARLRAMLASVPTTEETREEAIKWARG